MTEPRHIDDLTEAGLFQVLQDEGRDPEGSDWQIACGSFQGEAKAMRILGTRDGVIREGSLAEDQWRIVPVEEMT